MNATNTTVQWLNGLPRERWGTFEGVLYRNFKDCTQTGRTCKGFTGFGRVSEGAGRASEIAGKTSEIVSVFVS